MLFPTVVTVKTTNICLHLFQQGVQALRDRSTLFGYKAS